jgi:hypothetical protein
MCIIACVWGYCKSFAYLILASVVRVKDRRVGEMLLWTGICVMQCTELLSCDVLM